MNSTARQAKQSDVGWLIQSTARILRPVIRFVMGRVSCKVLTELMREIYIAEARRYLKEKNQNQVVTSAALAAMSGLDSRAIKAIQKSAGKEYTQAEICVEANILEMWAENPLFHDDQGRPAELNIHGPNRTFQGLVWRAAGRAVTPQTVLDDLVRSGNVEIASTNDRVRLLSPFYCNIRPSEQTTIVAGSLALHRLGSVLCHNIQRADNSAIPAWVQQDRWSIDIPAERLDQVRMDIRAVLDKHIKEVENQLAQAEIKPPRANQHSVGVGWYYWEVSKDEPVRRFGQG
ncbi:MAG: DUF6502 family protein [Wenzhouxiangella sp.]